MKGKLSVEKGKRGVWTVTSSSQKGGTTTVFESKAEAVSSARSRVPSNNIIVQNAAGQVLRLPEVKTSQPTSRMRAAVLEVVRARSMPGTGKQSGKRTVKVSPNRTAK